MRLTLRLLGVEVLHITTDPLEPDYEDDGDALNGGTTPSYPVGFTPTPGDQRLEPAPQFYPFSDDE